MLTIPLVDWIANAAVRLTGNHGAVTQQAHQCGCSRQCVYDHAQKVLAAVAAEHGCGPSREQLLRDNTALRQENAQLWDWLFQTIEFPQAQQQQFAVTALAMGLSLNQIVVLLTILLGGAAAPARSTVHRWGQTAAKAAGAVLKRLDQAAKTWVTVGCLDEIFFHRRPVLMGVEPRSMVWFVATRAADCQGSTWFEVLRPWTALSYVASDAGTGLQAGIAHLQADRRQHAATPLEHGLDLFHTQREATRVLKQLWKRVERTWEQAEAASRAVELVRRRGQTTRWPVRHAKRAWEKAATAFRHYEQTEAAWKRAEAALSLFRPEGQLNDRAWAAAAIAGALPGLSGPEWSKVRNWLEAEKALTFLDRLHAQLDQLGLPVELRSALVQLYWLRRQRPHDAQPQAVRGSRPVAPVVPQRLGQHLDVNWRQSYRLVAAVLGQAVRASSAVECLNSVVRMHQSRHRTLRQGMLDLKRLYWNTRVFRGGKRKGRCPYEHLGLALPRYDFWGLLQEELITAPGPASEKAPGIAA
jgi:tetratricopeptide (TPR) repeat protein